jgi:hypothetical protein
MKEAMPLYTGICIHTSKALLPTIVHDQRYGLPQILGKLLQQRPIFLIL